MQSMVRKEFKLLEDPDIDQYVSLIGKEVLAVAGPQFFDFQFFVIDNKDFNAFAAPSGLVFIHSGLLEAMENEDELVGVMAHEIGHVANRHIADRIDKAGKINIGTVAMVLAGIAMGGGDLSEAVIAGAMATGASMNLKFSRENEEEADRLAYGWMQKMGRSPEAMLSMLAKMRKLSILKMGDIPPYLLTHPDPARRMSYVQDLMQIDDNRIAVEEKTDFNFQRIRYRVLVGTKDATALLPHLLKKLPSREPKDFMVRFGLAQVYLHEGDYIRARQYLKEVIEKYPEESILKTDLGITYLRERNIPQALAMFQEARKSNRHDAFTAFYLAKTLEQKGEIIQAIELYEELLVMVPTFARLHYHLGRTRTNNGQPGLGHYHTGVYSWLEGDIKTAKYHLQKALEKLPKDSPFQKKSQDMLAKMKRLEKL